MRVGVKVRVKVKVRVRVRTRVRLRGQSEGEGWGQGSHLLRVAVLRVGHHRRRLGRGATVLLPSWCWWRWGGAGVGVGVELCVCHPRCVWGVRCGRESRNRGLQMSGGTEGDRDSD